MATLRYDITIVGMAAVNRAFQSIERRAARLNTQSKRMGGGAAGGGRGGGIDRTQHRVHRIARRNQLRRARASRSAQQKEARAAITAENKAHRLRISNIAKETRARQRAERQVAAQRRRTARAISGRIVGGAGGAIRAIGAGAAGMLAIGGGFAVAGAIGQRKQAVGAASALAAQARGTEAAGGRTIGQLSKGVLAAARPVSIQSGFEEAEVIGSMRRFHGKAGDIDAAKALAPFFADMADAVDAGLGDVGESAGIIFGGLRNQGLSATEALAKTKEILGAVAGQSKAGSIEMSDMAKNMGKLISATSNFEGDVGDLASKMSAFAQVAVLGEASSPEEAMTAILRFADDLVKNEKRFKKLGIETRTDKGELRDPVEVLIDVMKATGGDIGEIQKLFGLRAKKAVSPFGKLMRESGGGEAGVEAIRKRIENFTKLSLTEDQARKDALERRKASDKQFAIAMTEFNAEIGKKLLPALTQLIPKFVELIPLMGEMAEGLGAFLEFLAESPKTAFAALVLMLGGTKLAVFGLGVAARAAAKSLLLKALPGGGAAAGTAASTAGGAAAATTPAATAATVAGATVGTVAAMLAAGAVRGKSFQAQEESRKRFLEAHPEGIEDVSPFMRSLGILTGMPTEMRAKKAATVAPSFAPPSKPAQLGASTPEGTGGAPAGGEGRSGAENLIGSLFGLNKELANTTGAVKQANAALASVKAPGAGEGGQNRGGGPTVPRP